LSAIMSFIAPIYLTVNSYSFPCYQWNVKQKQQHLFDLVQD